MKNKILRHILNYYLNSKDYNGCPMSDLIKKYKDIPLIKQTLIELFKEESVTLYYCETNPYIKNFDLKIPLADQIEIINNLPNEYKPEILEKIKIQDKQSLIIYGSDDFSPVTLYPSNELIKEATKNKQKYFELPPFNKMMLMGMPHLHFLYFRIDVLNRFLYDPRYIIYNMDYTGSIYYKVEDESKEWEDDENRIYLNHFGLGYNKKTNENVITIFPHDLAKLSEKHQYHFYSHLLDNQQDYIPDVSYYKNVMGEPSDGISIFYAFFEEMIIINQMFEKICDKKLFKNQFNFTQENRPEYFHPFLMPTKTMYGNFCRTLSRIFADKLDKEAIIIFANKLRLQISKKTVDGKEKGSLNMLQELFSKGFRAFDGSDTGVEIIDVWKNKIFVNRSKHSHSFIDDIYDIKIFDEYRKTMNEAYKSVRTIRLVLTTFPTVKKAIEDNRIKIHEDLYLGNINIYFSPLKIKDIID